MAEPVTVAELKVQLRLDGTVADEDAYLADLIAAARRAIEQASNQVIVGAVPTFNPADIPLAKRAILLLACHWYDNRDAADSVPGPVAALIRPLRRWCA